MQTRIEVEYISSGLSSGLARMVTSRDFVKTTEGPLLTCHHDEVYFLTAYTADGELVGFYALGRTGKHVEGMDAYVTPGQRGNGILTQLRSVANWCWHYNVVTIYVRVQFLHKLLDRGFVLSQKRGKWCRVIREAHNAVG